VCGDRGPQPRTPRADDDDVVLVLLELHQKNLRSLIVPVARRKT
jgi:hypothetical protein